MISACGRNNGHRAWWFALASLLLFLGVGRLAAQTSGKVEGRIRDEAGAPIPSAQVTIDGTAFGAVANGQGYYFINNVPAGSYTLTAKFVGYKSFQITGFKVVSGQITAQDFSLTAQPVGLEEITVEAAVNPLVPRDEVTSKQRVDGELTRELPVDRVSQVLALQPGVTASPSGNTLQIRGGRDDENVVYIDGVPVQSGVRGTAASSRSGFNSNSASVGRVEVGTNGFEDASVTTGALSSEFGNAQSGLIAITTKSGGSRFAGNLAYETDEPLGANHGPGFNRVEAGISGPLYKNLTFAVSGYLEGQQGLDRGWEATKFPEYVMAGIDTVLAVPSSYTGNTADTTYVAVPNFAISMGDCDMFKNSANAEIANNYGLKCQGVRATYTPRGSYNAQAKLNYSYGTGSRVSFTGLRTVGKTRLANNDLVLVPQRLTAQQNTNDVLIVNWTQNLSKSSDRALALEVYGSYQSDRTIVGALKSTNELDTRSAFGGFEALKSFDFLFDFDNFPVTQKLIDAWRTDGPGQVPLDPDANYTTSTAYRLNPYGLSQSQASVIYGQDTYSSPNPGIQLTHETRYIGRANLDWQVDRYNRLKLGGELTQYHINHFGRGANNKDICFCDAYIEKPIRYDAFLENQLDLGDVIVVGGLRYDFYDSKASHQFLNDSLVNNGTINAPYPFPDIYSRPGVVFSKRDKSHSYVSPHIQVSFPVTEKTNFRLSYAHQVQAPDFAIIYSGINTDLGKTNTNQLFGTDLDFAKTITFEFGVRHSFNEDMVLDVAAYNKDKLADATARIFKLYDPIATTNNDMRFYTSADFGTIRGLDVRIDRRFGNLFNGVLSYGFQDAKNTGSDPQSYVSFFANLPSPDPDNPNGPPPQAILPTTNSRPHTLAGALQLTFPGDWKKGTAAGTILKNVGMFATFRLASGTAYTRCDNTVANEFVFAGTSCTKGLGGNEVNRTRLPAFKEFNLRVTKGFALAGTNLTFYADARNLFNFKNIRTVYTGTGDITNTLALEQSIQDDTADVHQEARINRQGQGNAAIYDDATQSIDLTAPGTCDAWQNAQNKPASPNCFSLIRAEQRFGDGDGVYSASEQRAAARAIFEQNLGTNNFVLSPRRIRLGVEVNF